VATVSGGRAVSPVLPPCDTPQRSAVFPPTPDGSPHPQAVIAAAEAWRAVTPSLAGTPHVRTSRDDGRTYPARHARPLPTEAPGQPCTVPVYDAGAASGRMLALDLDPARGDVDRQAAELGQLLERLGARHVADVATSTGGRHILIPFAAALPWLELRDLCRAIAARFPAVDPAPMCSLGGQISPPGSRAKRGGWRVLTIPLSEALAAAEHPNGPETWSVLQTEFAAELQQAEGNLRDTKVEATSEPELDDAGVPWVPRLGGSANLSPELARTARTGTWDRSRYADRSAARMAVLTAAAARGWRLADVRSAIASGAWKGFPGLYERPSEPGRMDRLIGPEWRKAITLVAGSENPRNWLTSDVRSRPPADHRGADEFGLIRQWVTGTGSAAADPERARRWGRRSVAIRQLLAAIGQAAMISGSSVLEFGTRNLALQACLSQRTGLGLL
jgi:hypothetical protein